MRRLDSSSGWLPRHGKDFDSKTRSAPGCGRGRKGKQKER